MPQRAVRSACIVVETATFRFCGRMRATIGRGGRRLTPSIGAHEPVATRRRHARPNRPGLNGSRAGAAAFDRTATPRGPFARCRRTRAEHTERAHAADQALGFLRECPGSELLQLAVLFLKLS